MSDERYRSRKWILHKNTAVAVLVAGTVLVGCKLVGVEAAPDVAFTMKWAATTMGVILGAYSAANIVTRKVSNDGA